MVEETDDEGQWRTAERCTETPINGGPEEKETKEELFIFFNYIAHDQEKMRIH